MAELTIVKTNFKCRFCGTRSNDFLKYGHMYKLGRITAHYYCVLLSNKLTQSGKDDEGILGFLLSDIKAELRRTSNILCIYCKKGNATIECSNSKCRRKFHLPCGLKNGSSHQFVCQFNSFCHVHKPVQNIPQKILKQACGNEVICCICQERVNVLDDNNSLWAPCCLKTWYHRNCVQKLAHSAGYFCRCPACNDSKKFNKWMQNFGIFIPQQDASWELAPNAFDDLLYRYNNCDADECKCPRGRQSSTENTIWEIILCDSCGSQGVHVACGNLKFHDPEWECGTCSKITEKVKSVTEVSGSCKGDVGSVRPEVCEKKRRRDSDDLENSVLDKRKKCRTNVEEEDVEIDVETVDEEVKDKESSTGGQDGGEDTGVEHFVISPEPSTKSGASEKDKTRDTGITDHVIAEEGTDAGKNDPQEVLKSVKPGPLSYKLSILRRLLGDFTVPKTTREKSTERYKDAKSSSSTEVIELSDSEEENDVEIIYEVREQTPVKHAEFVLHCRGVKESPIKKWQQEWKEHAKVETLVSEEKQTNPMGPQQFCLGDFEVVAVVSLQPAEKPEDGTMAINHVNMKAAAINCTGCYAESVATNCQKTATRDDKEVMPAVDDDVIILTD